MNLKSRLISGEGMAKLMRFIIQKMKFKHFEEILVEKCLYKDAQF